MRWCLDGDGQVKPVNLSLVVEQVMMNLGSMRMKKYVMVDAVMDI